MSVLVVLSVASQVLHGVDEGWREGGREGEEGRGGRRKRGSVSQINEGGKEEQMKIVKSEGRIRIVVKAFRNLGKRRGRREGREGGREGRHTHTQREECTHSYLSPPCLAPEA